jgi:hypothetical protein
VLKERCGEAGAKERYGQLERLEAPRSGLGLCSLAQARCAHCCNGWRLVRGLNEEMQQQNVVLGEQRVKHEK